MDTIRPKGSSFIQYVNQLGNEAGAECMVVACSLCHGSLDTRQQEIADKYGREYYLPIFYFTELMGLAMGHDVTPWFRGHLVDPTRLLTSKGLM